LPNSFDNQIGFLFLKPKIITMADLTQEEWTKMSAEDPNSVILDVRTPEEVEEGIIGDAMHLDIYTGQAFVDALEKLDKNKNYYVYCRSGNRSGQACAIMNSLGFSNAYNLKGGILEWEGEVH
jgi:rhodanese-related sulfurtransferase